MPVTGFSGARQPYATLTGRSAPAAGDPAVATLPPAERQWEQQVRAQISRELGRERIEILRVQRLIFHRPLTIVAAIAAMTCFVSTKGCRV